MANLRNRFHQDYSRVPQVDLEANNADLPAVDRVIQSLVEVHPYLHLEPVCQHCHAKQSDTTLFLCTSCSVVSYCSEECCATDSHRHRTLCLKVVQSRERTATKASELHQKYGVVDVHEAYRQGFTIANCATYCCDIFRSFVDANTDLADALCELAEQGETKTLWEHALEWHVKCVSLGECLVQPARNRLAGRIPFILIRLNRLDDACGFIQKYVAYQNKNAGAKVSDWYECQGRVGARFEDCVTIARSLESSSRVVNGRTVMLVALLVVAMRARPAAARSAWERTVNNVFLRTDEGRELLPACSTLYEMFSLSDDTLQMEKIKEIVAVVDRVASRVIPDLIALERQQSPNGSNVLFECETKCFLRTPDAVETLREIVNPNAEESGTTPWAWLPDCEMIGSCIGTTIVLVVVILLARVVFGLLVFLTGIALDFLCFLGKQVACDYSRDFFKWYVGNG